MAQTSKKKTTTAASGGKRAAPSSRSGTRSRSGGGSTRRSASNSAAKPIRRQVAGVILLLAALCVIVTYFGASALLLKPLATLIKGLCGHGYYVSFIGLLIAAYVLLFSKGLPVGLRVTSAIYIPVAFGALWHLVFATRRFTLSGHLFGELWHSGVELASGGVISGLIAVALSAVLSPVVTGILLVVLLIAALLILTRITPAELLQRYRDRPRYEPDETQETPIEHIRETVRTNRAARRSIDVPLDVDMPASPVTAAPAQAERAAAPSRSSRSFFRSRSEDLSAPSELQDPPKRDTMSLYPPAAPAPQEAPVPSKTQPVPLSPGLSAPAAAVSAAVSSAAQPVRPAVPQGDVTPARPRSFFEPKPQAQPPVAVESDSVPAAPAPAAPTRPAAPSAAPVSSAPAEPENAPAAQEAAPRRKADQAAQAEIAKETAALTGEIEQKLAAPEQPAYEHPPLDLLNAGSGEATAEAGAELRNNARRLANTLTSFGVDAAAGDVIRGPSVTRYEFMLEQGVKLSKVTNLTDDIALQLGVSGVRVAPIPDKISVVGVEVPNREVTPVLIRDVLESDRFQHHKSNVAFAVGKDISGNCIVGNIEKLPHLLIAGTTGSGKSVCTNSLIVSLIYKSSPEDVRFIMVDPKMVELAPYNGIPHLLIPVVTDPKKAAGALQWAVYEMMKRYKTFSEHGVKKLEEYNRLAAARGDLPHMPAVVVLIDELADLMLVAAKEVEESICRVAQMGRAAGMHLVIATQRPSADVITGLMKANIPSRIAFAVASSLESRIILDQVGAEKLVGKGDMLYAPLGEGKPTRVQGCFISPEEIDRVVDFVKSNGTADYSDEVLEAIEKSVAEKDKGGKDKGGSGSDDARGESDYDELLPQAVDILFENNQASTSMLQRRLKLGYSRASRLIDQMEELGIVGPFEGSKPRQLLITRAQWQQMQSGGAPENPESLNELEAARAMAAEADSDLPSADDAQDDD